MIRHEQTLEQHGTIERLTDFLRHAGCLQKSTTVTTKRSATPQPSAPEPQRILGQWNDTVAEWPQHHCVHELVEMQATRTPDAVAVVCGDEQLTYQELNYCSNQLAHRLQQMTSGMDVPIGICVERSLEMAIGVLSILKSGAAYCPFDPTHPEQLLHLNGHTLLPVILTQQKIAPSLPRSCAKVVFLDSFFSGSIDTPSPPRRTTPGNLAYVNYTWGATDVPVAVAMPHRPLVNFVAWHTKHPCFSRPARTLQFAPLSSSVSCQEVFSTWATGGTLVLVPEAARRDLKTLLKSLENEKIERLFLPSVILQQLADASSRSGVFPTYLRDIICMGEPLRISPSIASFFEKLGNCALHHHYGSAESPVAAAYTLTGPPNTWPLQPPLGRPIANTKIYLLDADLQPAAPGMPGEIFIGGECLAQGYLHRPHLTAKRFVTSPFGATKSERLYRTGELARYLENGYLEYLGRADDQVKIRGTEVTSGLIDALLSQHPAVGGSICIPAGGDVSERCLYSYVLARSRQLTATDLRHFLCKWLPEYMVPSQFVFLDALPLTPDGKIDRRLLPAPGTPKSSERAAVVLETRVGGGLHSHTPVAAPRLKRT